MKVKTWIPLVLAVVLGLAAAKLMHNVMKGTGGKVAAGNLVSTVTAAHDIEPGQRITPLDLATVQVPATAVPTGSFQNTTDLVERVALVRLVKGQHVLESTLAPIGTAAGVQALIPDGMRAITVQVNEFSGVAGLLMPGSKVDIISVIRNDENGSVARTIVQNVEVRAIGRQITPATSGQPAGEQAAGAPPIPFVNNVTLLVTPQQAEAVQLASVGGHPWLVLRNSNDVEPIDSDGTSMADLRGDSDKPLGVETPTKLASNDPFADKGLSTSPATESPKTRTVKFIRATKEEAMTVEMAPPPPADWTTTSTDTTPVDASK